jgi:hypothetical protein
MFGAFEARVEAAVASSHTQHKGGIGFGNFAVCDSRGKLERSLLESPKFVCIRRKRNLMPSGLKRRMLRGYLSRVQHAHRSKLVPLCFSRWGRLSCRCTHHEQRKIEASEMVETGITAVIPRLSPTKGGLPWNVCRAIAATL